MDEKTGAAGSHVNYDEPVVRIEGLKKAFDDNVVLRNVNLEVYRGEVVVILGPSGSGKSTMLRCINLLETPTDGRIFFEDAEITGKKTDINKVRAQLGMVFQSFNLFPHLTAKGNVMLAQRKVLGRSKEEAERIAVEELIRDGAGKVRGVRAGEDEITAEVVIVAEGANALLSERSLGNSRPKPHEMAVGVKEVFGLPADRIEDRFLVPEGEGAAMLFVGDCTKGQVGGGFLYTNKDSISLGLVATVSTAADGANPVPVYQMLEDFKNHPAVAPIIRGAKMVEHSGHMVSEGGYNMIPTYTFDGALVAGDAAMLCMNLGYMVRGMDFAVASGRMAAEAAVEALDSGDTSAAGLAGYQRRMEDSFVIQDLRTFSKWPHVMEEWDTMFTDYPVMVKEVFNAMFSVDGQPQQPLRKRIIPIVKKRGLIKTAMKMKKAVSAL